MGLRDTVAGAAQSAIQAVGDLAVNVTIKTSVPTAGGSASYTPSTGVVTTPTTVQTVPGVPYDWSEWERASSNGAILETDTRLLVADADLTTPPQQGDLVELGGSKWTLHRILPAPGNVIWILWLRRS